MSIKKTVKVTNRQQLIDLNDDTVNFDLSFTATAKNGEEFEVVVVDQSTLDNNPNIEFKKANGSISGNIISDKNVYQNYFLCLRAPQPCEIEIDIVKKEIPPQLPVNSPYRPQIEQPVMVPQKNESTNWKMIILVLVVVGGCILLYYMYSRKNDSNLVSNTKLVSAEPNMAAGSLKLDNNAPKSTMNDSLFSSRLDSSAQKNNTMSDSLLARLNSISVK